jgi:hypothetical protein
LKIEVFNRIYRIHRIIKIIFSQFIYYTPYNEISAIADKVPAQPPPPAPASKSGEGRVCRNWWFASGVAACKPPISALFPSSYFNRF